MMRNRLSRSAWRPLQPHTMPEAAINVHRSYWHLDRKGNLYF